MWRPVSWNGSRGRRDATGIRAYAHTRGGEPGPGAVSRPISILPAVKACQEVCTVFCTSANPVEGIVARTEQGRGIPGVVDGSSPRGVENEADKRQRIEFLRRIGYTC